MSTCKPQESHTHSPLPLVPPPPGSPPHLPAVCWPESTRHKVKPPSNTTNSLSLCQLPRLPKTVDLKLGELNLPYHFDRGFSETMCVGWRLSKPRSSAVSPHCPSSEHPAPSTGSLCTRELSLAAWSLLSLCTCSWFQTPGATFNNGRGQLSLPLGKDNSTPAELSFTYPTLY